MNFEEYEEYRRWREFWIPHNSGDFPYWPSRYGKPVFRRASEGGCSLKLLTRLREREMLKNPERVAERLTTFRKIHGETRHQCAP